MGQTRLDDVVIASSGTDSTIIEATSGWMFVGLLTPGTLTSTTLTFEVGTTSGAMLPLHFNTGVQYGITSAASQRYLLEPTHFIGARFIRVVAGSAEAAERTLTFISVPRDS